MSTSGMYLKGSLFPSNPQVTRRMPFASMNSMFVGGYSSRTKVITERMPIFRRKGKCLRIGKLLR